METKSDLRTLLAEIYTRLIKKSPRFFRVMTWVNAIIAVIGGIPLVLIETSAIFPPKWVNIVSQIILFAGAWGVFMANLPVARPNNLPFTEKKQEQENAKNAP